MFYKVLTTNGITGLVVFLFIIIVFVTFKDYKAQVIANRVKLDEQEKEIALLNERFMDYLKCENKELVEVIKKNTDAMNRMSQLMEFQMKSAK